MNDTEKITEITRILKDIDLDDLTQAELQIWEVITGDKATQEQRSKARSNGYKLSCWPANWWEGL